LLLVGGLVGIVRQWMHVASACRPLRPRIASTRLGFGWGVVIYAPVSWVLLPANGAPGFGAEPPRIYLASIFKVPRSESRDSV